MKTRVQSAPAAVVLVLAALFGCSSGDPAPPAQQETALETGSTCADMDHPTVTYSGWAADFFASYCTRCHSSTLTTSDERSGATPHANWDDLPTIRAYLKEIDSYAAGGPNGVNHIMPPSDPTPTDDERIMLGQFLACGAPD